MQEGTLSILRLSTLDVPGREWGDTESIVPWMLLQERIGVILPWLSLLTKRRWKMFQRNWRTSLISFLALDELTWS